MTEFQYYYQTIPRVYFRGISILGFVMALSITAAPHVAMAARLSVGVLAFTYLWVFWYIGGTGVEVRHDGLHARRYFRTRYIPWQEIDLFLITRRSISPTVYVRLKSGQLITLPFTQGRMTRWNGGKSRDTVAALNTELAKARASLNTPTSTTDDPWPSHLDDSQQSTPAVGTEHEYDRTNVERTLATGRLDDHNRADIISQVASIRERAANTDNENIRAQCLALADKLESENHLQQTLPSGNSLRLILVAIPFGLLCLVTSLTRSLELDLGIILLVVSVLILVNVYLNRDRSA